MTHPLIELGGNGPLIHLAPANGFPPATYVPALRPLMGDHRVVSLPPRAMWPDAGPPPDVPGSWIPLAEDLLAGIRQHRLPPLIGVGHSFGAVATLLAAVRDRTRFRAIALLDPTIFPPAIMEEIRRQRERGETLRPLAEGARKRRDRFGSEEEAFAYWRPKPLFNDWADDAVRRYTRAMLRPAEGGGLTLTWPGAWEAYYYESFHTGSWDEVSRLDPGLPVLVVGGGESDTLFPEAAALLRERIPWARQVTIAGYGHLFPQAAPEETGRILAGWVGSTVP